MGQINEQQRQGKSQTNKNPKINVPNIGRTNQEMDCFDNYIFFFQHLYDFTGKNGTRLDSNAHLLQAR